MALIPFVQFGCLHLGNRDTDYKLAYKYRAFVRENKEVRAIVTGDNFDACLPCHKPQTMWNQKETPQIQYERGLEFFGPIASKIEAACTSNHSDRIWRMTSLDLDKNMARELGYLNKYMGVLGLIPIKVGRVTYNTVICHGQHGTSGSWKDAHKALSIYPNADLVCLSHTHEMAWILHPKFNNQKRLITTAFVRTGSVINYPRYAKQALYTPKLKGFTIIWFDDERKRIQADITGEIPS